MSSSPSRRWQFWIDRGGTFTDLVGRAAHQVRERAAAVDPELPAAGRRRGNAFGHVRLRA
jgi:N-methylhydantoinase A/oxoprolinase/acetone carboxylase beta subunit